ncbi:MAG: nitroreductase family protein [Bacteroidetes bacterium]|nr:nitroreductase family protein [Bacteroidota bacterium]MCW5896078.1 nitroreductase family protein [Bacteroidota bacterium]
MDNTIRRRWSPKGFLDIPVEPEKLVSLFEAARWSPSSRNEQPWRFIVETKSHPEGYERLFSTLTESNKSWAGEAPVLIAGFAKKLFERDNRFNRVALYDTGGAVANLTVQAVSLGLQVHQMGGYDMRRLRELYSVPEEFEPAAILAVGYADEEQRTSRVRLRHELHTMVYEGVWGSASGFLRTSLEHHIHHQ